MKTNPHNFVQLAQVHLQQKTLYCAGLDIHSFGSLEKNLAVYGSVVDRGLFKSEFPMIQDYYQKIAMLLPDLDRDKVGVFSDLAAKIECYLRHVINVLVQDCNIRVFKPQSGYYESLGPLGVFMLSRIRKYIKQLGKKLGIRLIVLLDCKRGDIVETQAAYFIGLLDNLKNSWGIDYSPFDFDILNVTPWMGQDVLVLGTAENPGLGLNLMRAGKGIIIVNKSSNPYGPQYQELMIEGKGITLQMLNVRDACKISQEFGLEQEGLSTIGLVVGSTHQCDGSIRKAFPSTTMLVPGFGAQGGKFKLIMPELISDNGPWNGLGAIFSSSRGTMFAWQEKLGGSGKVENLEDDLAKAISNFRIAEEKAFADPEVISLGINYPFAA